MANEEFIRKNYCDTVLCLCPSEICKEKNSFCPTAQAMLDAVKWREENPDGLVGIYGAGGYSYDTEGYFFENFCRKCGNLCIASNCEEAYAVKTLIELKDEEMAKVSNTA